MSARISQGGSDEALFSFESKSSCYKGRRKQGVRILELNSSKEKLISDMSLAILANYGGEGEIKIFTSDLDVERYLRDLHQSPSERGRRFDRVVISAHSSYFALAGEKKAYPVDVLQRRIGETFTPEQVAFLLGEMIKIEMTRSVDLYCCEVGVDMRLFRIQSEADLQFKHQFNSETGELSVFLSDLPSPSTHEKIAERDTISTMEWIARQIQSGCRKGFILRGFCGAGYVTPQDGMLMRSIDRAAHEVLTGSSVNISRLERLEKVHVRGINDIHSVVIEVVSSEWDQDFIADDDAGHALASSDLKEGEAGAAGVEQKIEEASVEISQLVKEQMGRISGRVAKKVRQVKLRASRDLSGSLEKAAPHEQKSSERVSKKKDDRLLQT